MIESTVNNYMINSVVELWQLLLFASVGKHPRGVFLVLCVHRFSSVRPECKSYRDEVSETKLSGSEASKIRGAVKMRPYKVFFWLFKGYLILAEQESIPYIIGNIEQKCPGGFSCFFSILIHMRRVKMS